ncbi:unnamed protein product [Clonostachys byssicola]|uniref:Uncharacterized protein n=1 Tax=Clonostachys byssicola TaxID=160290 RepID=A0A9N9Y785_9HYPO|nr:unnamed protein product [Clonostachys byssicola]
MPPSPKNPAANAPHLLVLLVRLQNRRSFAGIVAAVTSDIGLLDKLEPFDAECDATAIYIALRRFVEVHQALLNIVIGENQILEQVPIAGAAVAGVLRTLKSVVDMLANAIIDLIPSQKECAKSEVGKLSETLGQAQEGLKSCTQPKECATGEVAESAQSIDLQGPANDLSATSISAITAVPAGFGKIVAATTKDIGILGNLRPLDAECDAAAVSIALTKFIEVHQALLNIIIRKAAPLSKVPLVGAPVTAALRAFEGVVDEMWIRIAKGINLTQAMSWTAGLASLLTGRALAGEPGYQQYPDIVTVEVTSMIYLEFGACYNQCPPQTNAQATACSTPPPVTLTLPTHAPEGWNETIAPACSDCPATVIHYEPNDAEFVTMTTKKGYGPYPTVSTVHPECAVCTGTVIICEPVEPTANAYIGPDGLETIILPGAELDGPRVTLPPQRPGEPATVVIGAPGFDKDLSTITLPGSNSSSPTRTLLPTGPSGEPIPGGSPIVVVGDGDVPGFSNSNGLGPDGLKTIILPGAELDGPRVTLPPQRPGEPSAVVIGTPGFDKDLSTITLPGSDSSSPIRTLLPTGPSGEPIPGSSPIVVVGDGDIPGFSDGKGLGPGGDLEAGKNSNPTSSPDAGAGTGSGGGDGLTGTSSRPGISPSDTLPSGILPSGISPSGTLPSGISPSDTLPSGILPSDTLPSGILPSGISPSGTLPSGIPPSDTLPSGISPSDTLPSGILPSGTLPSGISPSGTLPSGISPSDTLPSGTLPSGTPPPTSCVPTVSPTQSACVTALPQACSQIESLKGLALIPAVPLCLAALGPFAVGNVATCLTTSSINISTAGSDITNCLTTAFEGRCINTLPQECENLKSKTGLALVPDLAICTLKLGPFAVGSALTCLSSSSITDSSTGTGVVGCLETALGLSSPGSSNGGGDSCTPSTGGQTCVTQLPPTCSGLQNSNGLGLITAIPTCLASLGAYGVGNAAQCLVTTSISVSSVGSDIVNCLLNAFKETCIAELPPACSNLANDDAAKLIVDIPLCVAALGPFAVGGALTCLSTTAESGSSIVDCLKNALL